MNALVKLPSGKEMEFTMSHLDTACVVARAAGYGHLDVEPGSETTSITAKGVNGTIRCTAKTASEAALKLIERLTERTE